MVRFKKDQPAVKASLLVDLFQFIRAALCNVTNHWQWFQLVIA
uniref:Uncharacterized protein n=1 Tax=Loigolactobacillus rennini TaxID=238013 RepID=A0A1K2I488_9LACO|nr:hypothetical protein LREN565_0321 [Loigolactobacillus rennini]